MLEIGVVWFYSKRCGGGSLGLRCIDWRWAILRNYFRRDTDSLLDFSSIGMPIIERSVCMLSIVLCNRIVRSLLSYEYF